MERKTLEQSLHFLLTKAEKAPLTIRSILDILSGKGRYFLVLLLAFPFCQPIQIPGTSIPFGLVIAFLGIRIGFGHHMWLPQAILKKKISYKILKKIVNKSLWVVAKLKKVIHPRWRGLLDPPIINTVNGSIITILGLLLALPLPIPFTNMIISWALILLSIGLIEEDGLFIVLGYLGFLLSIGFFIFLGISINFLATR